MKPEPRPGGVQPSPANRARNQADDCALLRDMLVRTQEGKVFEKKRRGQPKKAA